MKVLIGFVLVIMAMLFGVFGFDALVNATSVIHQIFAFMCIGFAGLFIGQIGIMISAKDGKQNDNS